MEGQPKGLALRNPAKPGFRHEVPQMRPYYLKNLYKCKTAVISRLWPALRPPQGGRRAAAPAGLYFLLEYQEVYRYIISMLSCMTKLVNTKG
jgi:hypothetical protein